MAIEILDKGACIALFAITNIYEADAVIAAELRGKGVESLQALAPGGGLYAVRLTESAGVVGQRQIASVLATVFSPEEAPEFPGTPTIDAQLDTSDGVSYDTVVIAINDAILDAAKPRSVSVIVFRAEMPIVQRVAIEVGP